MSTLLGVSWLELLARLVEALAWPLAVIAVAVLVTSARGQVLVNRVLRRVQRVSALGVQVELTAEAAARNKADLETTFTTYRRAIASEFDRRASALQIPELRRHVVESAVRPHLRQKDVAFRSTIHVRDILVGETMSQLLDYYPSTTSRRTAGRTFSMRFGIVGEAWRTGTSQLHVIDSTLSDYPVKHWGMLPDEAATYGHGSLSFVAVVLRHKHVTVAVFYFDSQVANAFDPAICSALEEAASESGLTSALADLDVQMRERGPALTIFDA